MSVLKSILKLPWRVIQCIHKIEDSHALISNHLQHHQHNFEDTAEIKEEIVKMRVDIGFIKGKLAK